MTKRKNFKLLSRSDDDTGNMKSKYENRAIKSTMTILFNSYGLALNMVDIFGIFDVQEQFSVDVGFSYDDIHDENDPNSKYGMATNANVIAETLSCVVDEVMFYINTVTKKRAKAISKRIKKDLKTDIHQKTPGMAKTLEKVVQTLDKNPCAFVDIDMSGTDQKRNRVYAAFILKNKILISFLKKHKLNVNKVSGAHGSQINIYGSDFVDI